LDGRELEDAKAGAYFENEGWLMADQGGGSVTAVGTETDSAGIYTVLEASPPARRARRLWFDPKTGLLARGVVKSRQEILITSLWHYPRLAGRLRAGLTRVSVVGMPANDVAITLDSLWANQPLPDSLFAAPSRSRVDVRFLGGGGSPVEVPFRYA